VELVAAKGNGGGGLRGGPRGDLDAEGEVDGVAASTLFKVAALVGPLVKGDPLCWDEAA